MSFRKNFVFILFLTISAFLTTGCGSDDSGPAEVTSENCLENGATASSISANTGHSLTVPKTDIAAGTERDYTIQGTADHSHNVVISDAQFAQLSINNQITIRSSEGGNPSHSHSVVISCL